MDSEPRVNKRLHVTNPHLITECGRIPSQRSVEQCTSSDGNSNSYKIETLSWFTQQRGRPSADICAAILHETSVVASKRKRILPVETPLWVTQGRPKTRQILPEKDTTATDNSLPEPEPEVTRDTWEELEAADIAASQADVRGIRYDP